MNKEMAKRKRLLKSSKLPPNYKAARERALKSTKLEMLRVIFSILDCPGHFIKPTIINNDDYFSFGPNPIVICTLCVERLRKALCLTEDEPIPSPFQYFDADTAMIVPLKLKNIG